MLYKSRVGLDKHIREKKTIEMYTGTQLTAARLQKSLSPIWFKEIGRLYTGCCDDHIYVHEVYLSFPFSARSRLEDTMVAVLS